MGLDMNLIGRNENTGEWDDVIYWRKVNCVHKFLVPEEDLWENDNCVEFPVSWDDLMSLKNRCVNILTVANRNDDTWKEVAEDLLPTESGFFWGSTEYDEWYLDDLKYTVEKIESIPEEYEEFLYEAWY